MILDLYLAYQFLRRLVTPFTQMDAYRLGIIDDHGNFLKKRKDLRTPEEKKALGVFDILVINLKKIIAKMPGGRTRLASLAAALYLVKEHNSFSEENIDNVLFEMEDKFNFYLEHVEVLYEDAPVNATTGIAGLTPDSLKVPKSAAEKYKKKNASDMLKMIKRKKV